LPEERIKLARTGVFCLGLNDNRDFDEGRLAGLRFPAFASEIVPLGMDRISARIRSKG
jgi:hypothetical protein